MAEELAAMKNAFPLWLREAAIAEARKTEDGSKTKPDCNVSLTDNKRSNDGNAVGGGDASQPLEPDGNVAKKVLKEKHYLFHLVIRYLINIHCSKIASCYIKICNLVWEILTMNANLDVFFLDKAAGNIV